MNTPATLLYRLCHEAAPRDWERFVCLFTPLLRRWAGRFGVSDSDLEDVLQELFVLLVAKLPEFHYDPRRSFRAWLWTVFRHSTLAWHKRQPRMNRSLEDAESPDSIAEATEAEYQRYLLARMMQMVRSDFPAPAWQVFERIAIEGRPGAEVAGEFGLTINAVYLTRSRILARLRAEMSGLDQ